MERGSRLSTFVHTNVLLANLCDRKKSLRQWDPLQPIAADDQQKNDLLLGILRRKRAANGWCE